MDLGEISCLAFVLQCVCIFQLRLKSGKNDRHCAQRFMDFVFCCCDCSLSLREVLFCVRYELRLKVKLIYWLLVIIEHLQPIFNFKQFCFLPTQCIYVFCVDLRTNSDYFPIQH